MVSWVHSVLFLAFIFNLNLLILYMLRGGLIISIYFFLKIEFKEMRKQWRKMKKEQENERERHAHAAAAAAAAQQQHQHQQMQHQQQVQVQAQMMQQQQLHPGVHAPHHHAAHLNHQMHQQAMLSANAGFLSGGDVYSTGAGAGATGGHPPTSSGHGHGHGHGGLYGNGGSAGAAGAGGNGTSPMSEVMMRRRGQDVLGGVGSLGSGIGGGMVEDVSEGYGFLGMYK